MTKRDAVEKLTGKQVIKRDFDHWGLVVFWCESGEEYAVGTKEEAKSACVEYIREAIWGFRAGFIVEECGLPCEIAEVIESFACQNCEGANEALIALVEKCCPGGIEAFAESAIRADGIGTFLSNWDGKEEIEGDFYIFRIA